MSTRRVVIPVPVTSTSIVTSTATVMSVGLVKTSTMTTDRCIFLIKINKIQSLQIPDTIKIKSDNYDWDIMLITTINVNYNVNLLLCTNFV